ncbi:MAG TPA: PEGA domain-containing protein [Vicinamibacteria bacterium]|nr:PEGA domain-containing protein [Vicinamibacteria bacterium]
MKFRAVFVVLFATVSPVQAVPTENETGTIEVRSTPPGASVYIEGLFSGTTPAVVAGVPAGSYRIVVKHDGLGDFAEDVVIESQNTAVVDATLPRSGYRSPVRDDEDYTGVVGKDARKPYENAKSQKKLSNYQVLEIGSFLVKSEDPLEPELRYTIFHDLAEQLDKKTKFTTFVTNYTKGPSERWREDRVSDDEPALVLTGVITEYQKGSQTKRYLVGFGAGKTRAYCLFRLMDKSSNEVVFERMENGSVSMGLFGGSSSGAMKEIGEDIAKAIEGNW